MTSPRRSASRTWPEGDPRIRTQILIMEFSKHKCYFACSQNTASISSTISTRKASMCNRGHRRPECGKLPGHLGMVDDGNPHPL
jgi:hypothetical protein